MKTKIGGQYLQMIRITPLTKTKKPYLKNPNRESAGGPDPYLWVRSLRGGDHRLDKWMKADPGTGSALGQNLWMINVACLGNWTRIEIEDQGIVINDTPDQDLRKIGTRLMSERMEAIEIEDQGIVVKDTPDQDLRKIGTGLISRRMEANMKSQNIMIKKVTGQSLMKGSTILKVNLVKIEIRSQSIVIEVIEGVPGHYHQKVSMTKEALHHIETRTILNTKDSGQNLLMPSITATMIMKIKMKNQSIMRNPCLNRNWKIVSNMMGVILPLEIPSSMNQKGKEILILDLQKLSII
jgi:hypothetical protein